MIDELESLRAANAELQSQRAQQNALRANAAVITDEAAERTQPDTHDTTAQNNNSLGYQRQLEALEADRQHQIHARDTEFASLKLQVTSLMEQLAMERDTTAVERREEVASLKRAMDRVCALEDALSGARDREDMLKAHLLEHEEELETLSTESAALKVEQARIRAEVIRSVCACALFRLCTDRLGQLDAALDRVEKFDEMEQQLHATERALRNLDEAVGTMTEEHKAEAVRRERVVRERVADEWKARSDKREAELGGEMAATQARLEALQMELERERHVCRDWAAKCAEINREVEPLREAFTECMRKLTEAVDKDAYAVDKRLVSNLLCSYFTMSDTSKRNEVLCLTLRILDVPRDRRNEIYRRNAGWLSAFSEDEHTAGGRSMSDMWIEFLIRESSERPREDSPPPLQLPQQPQALPVSPAAVSTAATLNHSNNDKPPPSPAK